MNSWEDTGEIFLLVSCQYSSLTAREFRYAPGPEEDVTPSAEVPRWQTQSRG